MPELAAHALIEGDATLAMTLYMAKNPLVALAFIRSLGGDNMSSEQFTQAPRVHSRIAGISVRTGVRMGHNAFTSEVVGLRSRRPIAKLATIQRSRFSTRKNISTYELPIKVDAA